MRMNECTKQDLTATFCPFWAEEGQKSPLSAVQIFGSKLGILARTLRIRGPRNVQCLGTCSKLSRLLLVVLITLLGATSCVTLKEDYYLASAPSSEDNYPNYFRIEVRGWAALSSARYIAGVYDDRAVTMFFNEAERSGDNVSVRPLFKKDLKEPGGEQLKPLSPTVDNGTFVMVLSTNAKAVTDAIGQFADNQVAADAISRLVSGSRFEELNDASQAADRTLRRGSAVAAEIGALFDLVPASPDAAEAERRFLDILTAIARAKGASAGFDTLKSAEVWFAAETAARRSQ